jgi:hypothetical protein
MVTEKQTKGRSRPTLVLRLLPGFAGFSRELPVFEWLYDLRKLDTLLQFGSARINAALSFKADHDAERLPGLRRHSPSA